MNSATQVRRQYELRAEAEIIRQALASIDAHLIIISGLDVSKDAELVDHFEIVENSCKEIERKAKAYLP